MNIHSHIEIFRLHGEHLRTLVDHLVKEIATIEQAHATNGNAALPIPATQLTTLEQQSEHIATEAVRLREILHSLTKECMDASAPVGEAPPSSAPPVDYP